MRLIYQ